MGPKQFGFREATMLLSDGTTLTIPEGVVTAEERHDPSGYGNPQHYSLKAGLYMQQPVHSPMVEFTLVPESRHQHPYTVTQGHANVTISRKDLDAMATTIVATLMSEISEWDGLDIGEHPEHDDIMSTLIELVRTELEDLK